MNKEAIIAEYLAGGISYRALADKYGWIFALSIIGSDAIKAELLKKKKGVLKK